LAWLLGQLVDRSVGGKADAIVSSMFYLIEYLDQLLTPYSMEQSPS